MAQFLEDVYGGESIERAARRVRKRGQHIYHHLNSIDEDAVFVESSIASLRSVYGCGVPALGNRRNGTWYSGKFSGSVYFKSTDGHHGCWNFA